MTEWTLPRRWRWTGHLVWAAGVLLSLGACGSPQGLLRLQGQKTVHPQDSTDAAPPARERSAPNPPITAWREQAAHEQGLVDALKRALDPARVRRLRVGLAHQMGYRDRIPLSASDLNSAPNCRFEVPVDRPLAAGEDPRSIFQRLLQLVADADRLPLCSDAITVGGHDYATCELFRIDNLADFYLKAIAGEAYLTLHLSDDDALGRHAGNVPSVIEAWTGSPMAWITGLDGFEAVEAVEPGCAEPGRNCLTYRVTPQASNRLLFGTFDTQQDGSWFPSGAERSRAVVARPMVHGQPFDALHAGTLSAWECDDFVELIAPVIGAFVQHERVDLLLDGMQWLNRLWLADPKANAGLEATLSQWLSSLDAG